MCKKEAQGPNAQADKKNVSLPRLLAVPAVRDRAISLAVGPKREAVPDVLRSHAIQAVPVPVATVRKEEVRTGVTGLLLAALSNKLARMARDAKLDAGAPGRNLATTRRAHRPEEANSFANRRR